MSQRIFFYDVVRVVACLMVVIMHSPMPSERIIGPFTYGLTYLTMPCIGLFFTVSGALLLPVGGQDTMQFVGRRVRKFITPVLVWTAVYLTARCITPGMTVAELVRAVLSVPFSRQEGVLWFMYALTGLYLIAPVVSPWLVRQDARTLRFYLGLWAVSLLFPYIQPFVTTDTTAYSLYYYTSGFAGYFILGFYLRRFGTRLRALPAVGGVILMLLLPVVYKKLLEPTGLRFGEVLWYLSLDSAVLVVLWWNALRPLAARLERIPMVRRAVTGASNLSFGVYLSHLLIMRQGIWRMPFVAGIQNYIVQTAAVILLTIALSFLFCRLVSLTPLGRAVVGCGRGT